MLEKHVNISFERRVSVLELLCLDSDSDSPTAFREFAQIFFAIVLRLTGRAYLINTAVNIYAVVLYGIFLAAGLAFFAAAIGYTLICEKL